MKPGVKTSEFYVTAAVVLAGLAALFGLAPKSADALTQVGGALTALGAAWAYAKNRAKLKSEAIEPAFGIFEAAAPLQGPPSGKVEPPKAWPAPPKTTDEASAPFVPVEATAAPGLADVVDSVQVLVGAVAGLVDHLAWHAARADAAGQPKPEASAPMPGGADSVPVKAPQE